MPSPRTRNADRVHDDQRAVVRRPPEAVANGVTAITAVDNRWLRCDIKSIALLPNVLMRQLAVDAGANEAILLRDGCLTEGSASNIFVVRDGVILTPPKSNLHPARDHLRCRAGARGQGRHALSRCARCREAELRAADEMWMTSATREVLAITSAGWKARGRAAYPARCSSACTRCFRSSRRSWAPALAAHA